MSSPSTRRTILARLVTSSFRSTSLRLHHLAPAEGQQLARQAGRALGRFDDVLCRGPPRRRIAVVFEQRQRKALDDRSGCC